MEYRRVYFRGTIKIDDCLRYSSTNTPTLKIILTQIENNAHQLIPIKLIGKSAEETERNIYQGIIKDDTIVNISAKVCGKSFVKRGETKATYFIELTSNNISIEE